jgi:hypothetical protein
MLNIKIFLLCPIPDGQKPITDYIIFKENFELKTIQTMRLKAPVTTIFLTKEDSHLLVGLNDGKLIVITGEKSFK